MSAHRILVVEDEFIIAIEIARVLGEAGFAIIGPAGTREAALRLADEAEIDAALLDASLHGESVEDVAAALDRRGIPFLWVTGHGPESLPTARAPTVVLGKPFTAEELLEAVRRLVGA